MTRFWISGKAFNFFSLKLHLFLFYQIESALSELREEDIDRPLGNPHLHEDTVRTRPAANRKGDFNSGDASSATGACSGSSGDTRSEGGCDDVGHAVDFKSTVMGDRLAPDAGEQAQEPHAVEATV